MERGLLKYIIREHKVSQEIDKIKWIKTRVLKIAAVEGCFLYDWD